MADKGNSEYCERVPTPLTSSQVLEILFGHRNVGTLSSRASKNVEGKTLGSAGDGSGEVGADSCGR